MIEYLLPSASAITPHAKTSKPKIPNTTAAVRLLITLQQFPSPSVMALASMQEASIEVCQRIRRKSIRRPNGLPSFVAAGPADHCRSLPSGSSRVVMIFARPGIPGLHARGLLCMCYGLGMLPAFGVPRGRRRRPARRG